MTTSVKTCFKCNTVKSLDQFYRHPRMADEHLNKCKACTRADVRQHRNNPKFRPKVLAYDRARGCRQGPEYLAAYRDKFPEKQAAHNAINNAVRDGRIEKPDRCSHCHEMGRVVGHHPDYSKPLEVVWLCDPCHLNLHAFLETVETKVVSGQAPAARKRKTS